MARKRTPPTPPVPPAGPQPSATAPPGGLTRRFFLQVSGLSLAAVSMPSLLASCDVPADNLGREADLTRALLSIADGGVFTVWRKEDLLAIEVGLVNLQLDAAGTSLVRSEPTRPAFLIVYHQPQHIIERAFFEDATNSDPPTAPPIESRIAGPSRVAFMVPDDVAAIPYDATELLDAFRRYEMNVSPNALPRSSEGLTGLLEYVPIGVVRAPDYTPRTGPPAPLAGAVRGGDARTATNVVRARRGARRATLATGLDVGLLRVADFAAFDVTPAEPIRPAFDHTSLELPYRLQLSPNRLGQWAHAVAPVPAPDGRVELWHTRLGVRGAGAWADERSAFLRTVRALWTRDPCFIGDTPGGCTAADDPPCVPPVFDQGGDPENTPFPASLIARDRDDIVHQSSNFAPPGEWGDFTPSPVQVNRLMLTTLGGWLDVRGDWGDCPPTNLSVWEHRATMGRDHFVKIVRTGYLYPFGHRAVKITITERKLQAPHQHTAYLRKRTFIVVKQPVLDLVAGRSHATVGKTLRKLPFTLLHIKTLTTPDLDGAAPASQPLAQSPCQTWFEPHVGGRPFRFIVEALDLEDRLHRFSSPVVFVEGNCQTGIPNDDLLSVAHFHATHMTEARCAFSGKRVAFAPSTEPDDTTYETQMIRFGGTPGPQNAAQQALGYEAGFLPFVHSTELAVEAARQLTGQGKVPTFAYHDAYVDHGFGPGNVGELLLAIVGPPLSLSFSGKSDRSGGFVTPNLEITGLTRKIGPVAGDPASLATDVAQGVCDPAKFFGGLDSALIFGVFKLTDLIPITSLASGAPKFITEALDTAESFLGDGQRLLDLLAASDTVGLSAAFTAVSSAVTAGSVATLPGLLSALEVKLTAYLGVLPGIAMADGVRRDLKRRAKALLSLIASGLLNALLSFIDSAEMAKDLRVRLEWRPPLQAVPAGDPIFEPRANGGLVLTAEVRAKDLPGKPAGTDLICSLEQFDLNLIAPGTVIVLGFEKLQFRVQSGKKPEVDVVMSGIGFDGVLSFVEKLSEIIPLDGFSDPPAVEVDETGISASFSLTLPNLSVGMFSLENMSIGAGFRIPFIGEPLTVSFNFCTRENPFGLTVAMLGGGGFFGLTLYPGGLYLLEAALEAKAGISLDFGVASGSVSVALGIYLRMGVDTGELTGYLRIRGEVEVLGLISVSIELRMELTYEFSSGKVIGRASIEIEVDLCLFSFTVEVTCERKFAGDDDDPLLSQVMDQTDWTHYIGAFAA